MASSAVFERRARVLKGLGTVIDADNAKVQGYLSSLPMEDLYELQRCAVPELAERLSPLMAIGRMPRPMRVPRTVTIPAELPEGLAKPLCLYQDRHLQRYGSLGKKGHTRSYAYAARLLSEPLRMANFLVAQGVSTFDGLRRRDVVGFMQAHPGVKKAAIDRFLKFLGEDRHFKPAHPPRPSKLGKPVSDPSTPPVMFTRDELRRKLLGWREHRTEPEYVLAWMVARLGLMAQTAYDLTLNQFALMEDGCLAIRPARVWVRLPKAVGASLAKLIDQRFPSWRTTVPERLGSIRPFTTLVPNLRRLIDEVFEGKTRAIRASALYAAMREGHFDRVTLTETLGVGVSTISKLERLLSADLHRRLPAELVEARNKHILGQDDDG
ncbi:MAG: hypothetical protein JSS44_05095 [Proteobacteria bacterium]|nr:hypothetical protein [Pseudomonadota bacterium]MBS0461950.1 hypothetical protein [Pseudomonadota bacterium]MBS0463608.1 hypothetical protein [Pseudomonadota bacterium]